MSLVTPQIEEFIKTQSWIRKMFEAAAVLAAKHGADKVFDFSLGNPDVPPPAAVESVLRQIAGGIAKPLSLGYCPNAGRADVRAALARRIAAEQQTDLAAKHVVVTCGAAGAINAFFRAVLTPGDEVVCFAPYFVEYGFYAGNYGGVLKPVMSKPLSFAPDTDALKAAITPKTRVMIVNSPNNPSGVVYTKQELDAVCAVLDEKSREYGRPIFLVSDEPYRSLVYDGAQVPPVLPAYRHAVVASSFSKSLSLAGERVGYIAFNPAMEGVDLLIDGVILTNRILGFVNAPVIGQQIVLAALDSGVDVGVYDRRRRAMAAILDDCGIEYTMPRGAFYFFPKVPAGYDDLRFIDRLMSENIIAVPGRGFGLPGYFRLTYCVDQAIIDRSAPAWKRALAAGK